MPEDNIPRRVTLVAAHPDDGEFMAAGTLAKWTRQGAQVSYVLCTSGGTGTSDPGTSPMNLAHTREREQRAAASAVGAGEVVFLRYPDNILENTIDLRRDITRQLRRLRPDLVICMDPTAFFWEWGLNHPDHRAAGGATLEAVFPSARDYHAFPKLIDEGLMPHNVSEVLMGGPGTKYDHYVDITDTFDVKLTALKEHKSQVGEKPQKLADFEKLVREGFHRVGERAGMKYAEAFRRIIIH